MRIRRCPFWLLTVLWVVICGISAQTLFAQESIPQDIMGAQTLSDSNKQTINRFLDNWVMRLQSDEASEVAEARAALTAPMSFGSQAFLDYYRPNLATRVIPLIGPDNQLMTRLNVAIISAKLTGNELVALLQASANDESPAVRYWIAKSVGEAAKAKAFDQTQQQAVLTVLADRLKAEDSSLVLEQILVALAEIQLPQAITTILDGLDARVAFHKDNPDARFKPVQNGMQQLWSKLIALRTNGQNVTKDLHELGRIAFRYYSLIADQMPDYENPLEGDTAAEQIKDDKAQMARRCFQVMEYVVTDVANGVAPQLINTNVGAELTVSRDRWRDIFIASPFNFNEQQLSVGE